MFRERHDSWRTTTSAECEHWLARTDVAVRPPTAQVPGHLDGHAAGEVFARLVRMNDGLRHAALKPAIVDRFAAVAFDDIEDAARSAAAFLDGRSNGDDADIVHDWIAGFVPLALGALCGIDVEVNGADVIKSARALAVAFGAAGTAEHTRAADRAVVTLADLLDRADPRRPLHVTSEASRSVADCRANEIGWFFQCFDASAALIGCSLAAMIPIMSSHGHPVLGEDEVSSVVAGVLAGTPPIHTTRRYPVVTHHVRSSVADEGDTVFVSLDPTDGPAHPFGWGAHRCPAEQLAPRLAQCALTRMLVHCSEPHRLRLAGWRPSSTARIPMFEVPR